MLSTTLDHTTKRDILIDALMPINMSDDPRLATRGVTQPAADYAGIHRNGRGWLYPIAPDVAGERWKNFDSDATPKYLWKPSGIADNARLYDPRGELHDHIAAADGVLILANGEADSWVCFSAGLFNVTCTLHGEGTIPPWFVATLIALGVETVRLWPDRDRAGFRHAIKVAAALAGSGIAVEVYALPYADDSKADLNTLWLDCGQDRDRFIAALTACERLPDDPAPEFSTRVENYTPPAEIETLRDQYCTDYVERAAVSAWNIPPANGKQLSRKNFSSPLRADRKPSAQWNYAVRGFKDYGNGGEFYSTDQVADLLGLQSWDDYKRDHAPIVPHSAELCEPIPTEMITMPRHYEHGIPGGIRELLNNWHNNPYVHIEGDDVERLGILYTFYEIRHDLIFQWEHAPKRLPIAQTRAMWLEAELDALWGDFSVGYETLYQLELQLSALYEEIATLHKLLNIPDPTAALSMNEVADLNRFGVSYKGLHALEQQDFFTFLFPNRDLNTYGKERATSTGGCPAVRHELPPIDEFWDRFFEYHRDQMWRALLVTKYRDLPVDLLNYDDLLLAMDELDGIADYDGIGAINDAIHPLLVEYDDRLREAQTELEWRIDNIRRRYIDTPPAPYSLAPGVTFTNPSQHKVYHLAITMQRDGGEIQDRYAAARAGGWTLPAYRSALKRAEKLLGETIVTVPNFTPRGTITSECESVTLACEAVSVNGYKRGKIQLHAPNGEKVTVSPGYKKHFDYDQWLEDNGGSAEIYVTDRSIDKLERLETPAERDNRIEVSKRQTAISSRRDYEAEAEARADRASAPGKVATWVQGQGAMIAPELGVSPDDPHVWRANFEAVQPPQTSLQEGETMPTFTAHTEPRETLIHTNGMQIPVSEREGLPDTSEPSEDRAGNTIDNDKSDSDQTLLADLPEPRESEVIERHDNLPNEVTEVSTEREKHAPREREGVTCNTHPEDRAASTRESSNGASYNGYKIAESGQVPTLEDRTASAPADQGDPSLATVASETPAAQGESSDGDTTNVCSMPESGQIQTAELFALSNARPTRARKIAESGNYQTFDNARHPALHGIDRPQPIARIDGLPYSTLDQLARYAARVGVPVESLIGEGVNA